LSKKLLDHENKKLFAPAFMKFYGREWEPKDRKRNPQVLAHRIARKHGLSEANLTKKRAREILLDFVGHIPLVEAPIPVAVKRVKPKTAKVPRVKKPKPQRGNFGEFYESREWFQVRYAVLKKYGGRCMICGRTKNDGVIIHVDHIKPRSKYPELELDSNNLQVLCRPCNLGKSNIDDTDWRTG
jgi:5-methylcytosine-specific restriction endonuclease McrA